MKDYRKYYQNIFIRDFINLISELIYDCETGEETKETAKQIYEAIFALPDTPRLFSTALEEIVKKTIAELEEIKKYYP